MKDSKQSHKSKAEPITDKELEKISGGGWNFNEKGGFSYTVDKKTKKKKK
ncbi:bacteriocin [Legionella birminghamensis]|uniref:Bacteriocin-type signal sequence n=1 Tax=Legionella birminghamensis TaxID=28083 RepID=A0A378I8H3_9GAMM|nr:bacteriocin [Legionella birminghamensis]STX31075.1 Uncharacterised protein [Legionella birminghamensis]